MIGKLPELKGYNAILIVMDCLSKRIHTVPCRQEIGPLCGLPADPSFEDQSINPRNHHFGLLFEPVKSIVPIVYLWVTHIWVILINQKSTCYLSFSGPDCPVSKWLTGNLYVRDLDKMVSAENYFGCFIIAHVYNIEYYGLNGVDNCVILLEGNVNTCVLLSYTSNWRTIDLTR